MKKKLYIEPIFLIILGILTSLSLPPYNYLIINFFTFSSLFLYLIKKSNQYKNKKLFFFYGWLFGFGYFGSSLYWISISLTFDQNFKFLVPLTLVLIPAFLSIFYGLVSYLFLLFRFKKSINSFLFFSLVFALLEFIRGSILTGFPWNLIAFSFSNQLEILSIVTLIGTYGFNLFCISLFASPALLILRNNRINIFVPIFLFICFVIFYFYGNSYKQKFYNNADKTLEYKVRLIGSNVSLDRFYSNANSILILENLIKISNLKFDEKTILVWPEAAIPDISQKELKEYKWLFEKNFNNNHYLIIGINSDSVNNGIKKYFNSFSLYDGDLNLVDSYNKIKLVPFGEFLPLENILGIIGLKSLTNNYQSFSSGSLRELIEIKQKKFSLKILPLICYEIIYSGKLFDKQDFDVIINISEDGWFGKSVGPIQHFNHSIFRAIESGKYILRSANNGIAAIINPVGVIEQKVSFGQSGYVDFKQIKKIQPTIFSKYGNKIFGLLILLYIFLIFSFNKIKNE